MLTGRTDTFKRVVFEDMPVPSSYSGGGSSGDCSSSAGAPPVHLQPGDYVAVEVTEAGGTLRGRPLARTTLQEFVAVHGSAMALASGADESAEALRSMAA